MTRRPRRRTAAALLLVALLGALWSAPASADQDFERARALRDAGEIVPFGVILEHTHQYHPGRVISVKFEEDDGRYIYELEVLDPEGVVWALLFDARTGKLMETLEESEEIRREKREDQAAGDPPAD